MTKDSPGAVQPSPKMSPTYCPASCHRGVFLTNFNPAVRRAHSSVPGPSFLVGRCVGGFEEVVKIFPPPIHNVLSRGQQHTIPTIRCWQCTASPSSDVGWWSRAFLKPSGSCSPWLHRTRQAWKMVHLDSMSPASPGTRLKLSRKWELKLLLTGDSSWCFQQT